MWKQETSFTAVHLQYTDTNDIDSVHKIKSKQILLDFHDGFDAHQ